MRIATFLICGVLGAACSDASGGGPTCERHSDCAPPEICDLERNVCYVQCRRNIDCEGGAVCVENICQSPDDCRVDADCSPFGLTCDENLRRCVPLGVVACNALTTPCPAGQMCTSQGLCRASEDGGGIPIEGDPELRILDAQAPPVDGGQPTPDRREPPDPFDMPAGPSPDVQGDPPDMGRPLGNRVYGEACGCASDCASGFCVENKLRASRTCTERCDRDLDCPGIDTCLQAEVREGGSAGCPPVDLGLENGQIVGVCGPNETSFPCADPSQCTSGVCLTPPAPAAWVAPQSVCTMRCSDDRKCPSGYRCDVAPGSNDRLCVPDLGPIYGCTSFDQCGGVCRDVPGRDPADLVLCLSLEDGDPGFCSCSCTTAADCPAGFACHHGLNSGDPARPATCVPMAGYTCPQEAIAIPPNPPFECASFMCIGGDEEAPHFSRCTVQCLNDADCPRNHDCAAIDDGQPGPDPQVCLPL